MDKIKYTKSKQLTHLGWAEKEKNCQSISFFDMTASKSTLPQIGKSLVYGMKYEVR